MASSAVNRQLWRQGLDASSVTRPGTRRIVHGGAHRSRPTALWLPIVRRPDGGHAIDDGTSWVGVIGRHDLPPEFAPASGYPTGKDERHVTDGDPARHVGESAPVSRPLTFSFVLFVALAVSSAINSALGALAPLITEDLAINRLQFGILASLVSLAAGLISPISGVLSDRYGGKRMLLALFVIAALGAALAGASTSYWTLVGVTLVLSVPLALGNPATNLLVSQYVAPKDQGIAVGMKQAGVPASLVLTGLALPPLGSWLGWQVALQTMAVVAILGLVLTLRSVPRAVTLGSRTRRSTVPAQYRSMARWFALYSFLMGSGMAAVSTFLPLFAHEELGMSVESAGRLTATIGLVSIGSRIAWGYLGDLASSVESVLRWMGIFAFCATMGLVVAIWFGGWIAWVAAVGFGGTAAAWHTPIMVTIVREVGQRSAGFVSGKVVQGFLIGKVASPVLFGWAVDAGAGFPTAWVGVGICFLLAAAVQLLRQQLARTTPA